MRETMIRPMRGTLYAREKVGEMERVVAPPYDVIDEAAKSILLERSPYNIVRLILPQLGGAREFWTDSAALFSRWKEGEVLAVDGEPCIYVYRQTYGHPTQGLLSRTGFLAAVRCVDFEDGVILPHERTFPRTRSERLELLRACKANFSQVFMIFRDGGGKVQELMEKTVSAAPALAFEDYDGVRHELWRLRSGAGAEEVCRRMEGKKLIIADGHHRYETALAYGREDAAACEAGHPRGFVSAVLFRSEDPGLLVLPVHRVLKRCPLDPHELVRRLERAFLVERIGDIAREGFGGERLSRRLEGADSTAFIMLTRKDVFRLALKDEVDISPRPGEGGSEKWRRLDANVLQSLVFGEAMGVDAAEMAEAGVLRFTPWEEGVFSTLENGEAEAAFLMRATTMDEIWTIAEGGERMPHKSSYFHPKLPSGLVIYDHETAFR